MRLGQRLWVCSACELERLLLEVARLLQNIAICKVFVAIS